MMSAPLEQDFRAMESVPGDSDIDWSASVLACNHFVAETVRQPGRLRSSLTRSLPLPVLTWYSSP